MFYNSASNEQKLILLSSYYIAIDFNEGKISERAILPFQD
jgi:hypothetical protein